MSTTDTASLIQPATPRVESDAPQPGRSAQPTAPTLDRKLAAEFLGTFVLVLTVGLASSKHGAGVLAPVAIGSALMVMVFAGGHLSGAHYNPAVSVAVLVRGSAGPRQTFSYIITQLVAGALAGLLARALAGAARPASVAGDWKVFVAEFLFTFTLAYVVFNVTAAPANKGNSFYGVAIGFTVATGAFTVGPLSGGVFNPAVAVGGSLLGTLIWSNFWIYVVASCLGGIGGALVFGYLEEGQGREQRPSDPPERAHVDAIHDTPSH